MKKHLTALAAAVQKPAGAAFKNGAMASALTAAALAAAVLLNLAVGSLPAKYTQFDLSQSGLYSIGEDTKQVLAGVSEPVTLYYLAQTGAENANLTTLLDRYAGESSQITWQQIDPALQPTFAGQYGAEDAGEGSIIVVSGQRSRVISESSMYQYDYSDYYTTGSVTTLFDGEQQLTSAIYYVSQSQVPVVYQLTGHGEQTLPSSLQSGIAEQNIQLESLSLLSAEGIPQDAAALIIAGPTVDYTAGDVQLLRSYLQAGGSLLLLTDAAASTPNLDALMADYGLSRLPGLVVEGDANYHYRGYSYYLLPQIASHEATQAVQDLYVMLPMAQAIESAETEGVSTSALLTTSSSAYNKAEGYDMQTTERQEGDAAGSFDLAVAAVANSGEDTENKVVWAGSLNLLDQNADTMVGGSNSQFLLGCTAWLAGQDSSILIAAKSFESEQLVTTAFQANLWGGVTTVALPALCLVLGAAITIQRRRQ